MIRRPPRSPLFPYTPLSRSEQLVAGRRSRAESGPDEPRVLRRRQPVLSAGPPPVRAKRELRLQRDRKSTRLNSSHSQISYAVFCLKQKQKLPLPLVQRYIQL